MKKIILASVALIAVFASCKKEDIRTVYETKAAEAEIFVSVYDAYLGADVTDASIFPSTGKVEGNTKVIITGNKAIEAQTVTITAKSSDGERTGTGEVKVASLLEGGVASYSCKVVIGKDKAKTGNKGYQCLLVSDKRDKKLAYLEKASHSHSDISHGTGLDKWCVNNTEFILHGETEYEKKVGMENAPKLTKISGVVISNAEEELLKSYVNSKKKDFVKETTKYSYEVSAFSYFNVRVTYETADIVYKVQRHNILDDGTTDAWEDIATISTTEINTAVEYFEIPSPTHASHYVHGHGVDDSHYSHYSHGHGYGGSNAGGGIVVAD